MGAKKWFMIIIKLKKSKKSKREKVISSVFFFFLSANTNIYKEKNKNLIQEVPYTEYKQTLS